MRKHIISLIIISAVLAFSCSNDKSTSKPTASTKTKAMKKIDGVKIFKMNCVICHGADGKLGINGARDLSLSKLTLEERIELIAKGKNTMTPFENILKKEQIKAAAEYTLTF